MYDPTSPCERQFTLRNVKKKHKFQAKLKEIHEHQKIKERVLSLAKDFEQLTSNELSDIDMIKLIDRYQRLDTEIQISIKAAADSVGRKNFGYQNSPKLAQAGTTVLLWKAILSCVRRKTAFSDRVGKLAQRMSVETEEYSAITHQQARAKLAAARKDKREIQRQDGEERAKWLEEIAQAAQLDQPDKEWEQLLKQMIHAARQRSIQRKVSSIMNPPHAKLDYIEVPNEQWYYSPRNN